ncbi:MAG: carbohydrate ABC transporter substrate-binding protein [Tetrasphaera sp.]|nr:carbohydrate ABC transporter substrate-binding protein [Tetrasphaera sp.]
MPRPATFEEYLASLVPPSVRGLDRRTLLTGGIGLGALTLAGCGDGGGSSSTTSASSASGSASGGSSTAATGTVTLGSNQSDAVPKAAIQSVMDAFQKANSGLTVKINTVDHNTFQENINNYLQGSPDDVFTWFAGYRMRFFASQGLAGDISDVWTGVQGLNDALKKSSTGDDGKQYFMPSTYYPWAIFYRKSLWKDKGYEIPKTLDDLKALGAKMKADGLDPIAFGDKDGWPAMGTFDQINLRVNGYDFHVNLMAGKEDWAGDKVKKVFETWRDILPLHQADSLGRTWQEAAQSLQQKKSGMYLLGMFVAQQFEKGAEQDDLDFFTFPEIDSAIGADAIEAPIDGYMMAANPKNEAGAKALLGFAGSAQAQGLAVASDPSVIATNSGVDTAGYTALQKKAVEFVASAKSIAQFMDRDTRPDFASTVMIPAIQDFIKNPADIDNLVKNIQAQKVSIFGS